MKVMRHPCHGSGKKRSGRSWHFMARVERLMATIVVAKHPWRPWQTHTGLTESKLTESETESFHGSHHDAHGSCYMIWMHAAGCKKVTAEARCSWNHGIGAASMASAIGMDAVFQYHTYNV